MVIRRRLAIRTRVHTTINSHGGTVVQQQQLNNKSPTYISRKTTFSQKLFFRSPWTHFSFFSTTPRSLHFFAYCFFAIVWLLFLSQFLSSLLLLQQIHCRSTTTLLHLHKYTHSSQKHTNIFTYINACTASFSCLQKTSFAISLYFNSVHIAITHQFLMHYIHIHLAYELPVHSISALSYE